MRRVLLGLNRRIIPIPWFVFTPILFQPLQTGRHQRGGQKNNGAVKYVLTVMEDLTISPTVYNDLTDQFINYRSLHLHMSSEYLKFLCIR